MLETNEKARLRNEEICAMGSQLVDDFDAWAMRDDDQDKPEPYP